MGDLTGRQAARMIRFSPWSFEPAGLQATLNNVLKGRGHVCPARDFFPAGFLLAKEARDVRVCNFEVPP